MNLSKQLKLKQTELSKEVNALEKFLKKVPEGKLVVRKAKEKFYYSKKIYLGNDKSNSINAEHINSSSANIISNDKKNNKTQFEEIYLPKDGKETLMLAQGEYAARRLKDAQAELSAVNRYLNILEHEPNAEQYLKTHPGIRELVAPSLKNKNKELEEWRTMDFYSNPYKPETINVPTVIPGFKVRSKSEADILARLVHFGIPFHYEEGIQTTSGWKFPDFCVRAIVAPYKIYYWEHLGIMDSIKYFSDNLNKLNDLYLCGIVPWKNLIITTETASEPLDINWVDEIINYYLL